MQLVLHYSCCLADLTLVELYILLSVIEIFYFFLYVSGTGCFLSAQEVHNGTMHRCWPDFFRTGLTVSLPPCTDGEPASVFHKYLQPHNPDQTCRWISIKLHACFRSSGLKGLSPLQDLIVARMWSGMCDDKLLMRRRLDLENLK